MSRLSRLRVLALLLLFMSAYARSVAAQEPPPDPTPTPTPPAVTPTPTPDPTPGCAHDDPNADYPDGNTKVRHVHVGPQKGALGETFESDETYTYICQGQSWKEIEMSMWDKTSKSFDSETGPATSCSTNAPWCATNFRSRSEIRRQASQRQVVFSTIVRCLRTNAE